MHTGEKEIRGAVEFFLMNLPQYNRMGCRAKKYKNVNHDYLISVGGFLCSVGLLNKFEIFSSGYNNNEKSVIVDYLTEPNQILFRVAQDMDLDSLTDFIVMCFFDRSIKIELDIVG